MECKTYKQLGQTIWNSLYGYGTKVDSEEVLMTSTKPTSTKLTGKQN